MRKRYLLFNANGVFSGTDDVLLGFDTEAERQKFKAQAAAEYGPGTCTIVSQCDVRGKYDLAHWVMECGHYVFTKC